MDKLGNLAPEVCSKIDIENSILKEFSTSTEIMCMTLYNMFSVNFEFLQKVF